MKLVFAPAHNSNGKVDAQGAFQPEARAFCLAHGIREPVKLFDNGRPMPSRFSEMLAWLDMCRPGTVDAVAFFCHGFKTGLQCGVTTMNAPRFATALERICTPAPRIIMYVCDAARDADDDRADDCLPGPGGEGGFADQLRDELVKRGVMATLYAHATVGHTTRNPFVRRFDSDDLAGGRWIVEPHSARWRAWAMALRGPMRFRYPFMTQAEIDAELQSTPPIA
jgi:hypothetical protein